MRAAARRYRPEAFAPPRGLEQVELCRVSYLRPVRDCPSYQEFFKDGDPIPDRLCSLHQGTFKQAARRAVQGFLDTVVRRLFGRWSRR
jgi:hypothetical protein